MARARRALAAVLVASALALGACGGDDQNGGDGSARDKEGAPNPSARKPEREGSGRAEKKPEAKAKERPRGRKDVPTPEEVTQRVDEATQRLADTLRKRDPRAARRLERELSQLQREMRRLRDPDLSPRERAELLRRMLRESRERAGAGGR